MARISHGTYGVLNTVYYVPPYNGVLDGQVLTDARNIVNMVSVYKGLK